MRRLLLIAAIVGMTRQLALAQATQPADDAAKLYLQAAKLIGDNADAKIISPSSSVEVYPAYPPYPAEWYRAEKAAFAANAGALVLVHQARSADHANWPHNGNKYLNDCRAVSNELADAALYQHFQKDDAAAIETVRDHLHLVELLENQSDKHFACLLASLGIRLQCVAGLDIITSNVALTKDASDIKDLQANLARELIRRLLKHHDAKAEVDGFVLAVGAEADSIGKSAINNYIWLAKAASAERDMAVMSLACHLYRFDTGNWPKSLDDLKGYLPSVPIDPWGDGKQTMGYVLIKGGLPDGSDRPLVYCRCESKDGLFFRNDQPSYCPYRGDGSNRPLTQQKHGGQFRDVASWAPPADYHPAATTQPLEP